MSEQMLLNGNQAAARAALLSDVDVAPTFPITPQSPLTHHLAEYVEEEQFDTEIVHLESDQSALAAAVGSAPAGARTYTASNSQGILYMAEAFYYASGLRLPIVMGCVNRAVSSPHSVYPDHNDALSVKDSHWLQFFCENNQEVIDNTIQLFKICEDERVRLPGMYSLESYLLSYTWESLSIPEKERVTDFLGEYEVGEARLDTDDPVMFNAGVTPDVYPEFKYKQKEAMDNALDVVEEVADEFESEFGRHHGGLVDAYRLDDADVAIATMGVTCSLTRDVVDELRDQGEKVGMLKVRSFRPFPEERVCEHLADKNAIGVIDRNFAAGTNGALYDELRSALYGSGAPPTKSYIGGLGGRDIVKDDIRAVYRDLLEQRDMDEVEWIGLRR